ncbi:hypothetical protein [Robertmurraya sp. P23]|uniref:hypothetical protein n=1 Tax=Robertmurraya sp. P23 TaxID=3436931 RepID=UPI003D987053
MSEYWRYLDRTCGELHLGVQMLTLFGQDLLEFSLRSPNTGVIRTGLVWNLYLGVRMMALFGQDLLEFSLGRPNAGVIRTGLVGIST